MSAPGPQGRRRRRNDGAGAQLRRSRRRRRATHERDGRPRAIAALDAPPPARTSAPRARRPCRAASRTSASTTGIRPRSSPPRTTSAAAATQAQYYSTDGGATWGQTNLPLASGDAFHSDPTVDWTSDGTAWSTTIGINSASTVLKVRAYKSTNGGATWTFDNTFSGTPDEHRQADDVGRPQRHVGVQEQHLRHLAQRQPGLHEPPHVRRAGARRSRSAAPRRPAPRIGATSRPTAPATSSASGPTPATRGIFVVKSTNGGTSYGTPVKHRHHLRLATTSACRRSPAAAS